MFLAAGAVGAAAAAAGTALDLLSTLGPGKSGAAKAAGVKQPDSAFSLSGTSASTPAPASAAPGGALSPSTFNALMSAQDTAQASSSDALKSLFAQIDGNADGKITKAEFQDKLGAGGTNTQAADNVFAKMDADDDGSISLNEMAAALTRKRAAPASPAANASSQYNIIDQMVQRQTDSLAIAAKQSVSIKV